MRIMLIGHSCSGKDTIAEQIRDITGQDWTKLSFGMDLGDVCRAYESSPLLALNKLKKLSPFLEINDQLFLDFRRFINKEDKHRTSLKVELGTWARMQDKDIWVRRVLQHISNYPFDNMVVTDCRLENEFVSLLQRGFIPISVEADDIVREQRRFERDGVTELPTGKSEEEINYLMSQCQFSVQNHGSQACLKKQVASVLHHITRNGGGDHQLTRKDCY